MGCEREALWRPSASRLQLRHQGQGRRRRWRILSRIRLTGCGIRLTGWAGRTRASTAESVHITCLTCPICFPERYLCTAIQSQFDLPVRSGRCMPSKAKPTACRSEPRLSSANPQILPLRSPLREERYLRSLHNEKSTTVAEYYTDMLCWRALRRGGCSAWWFWGRSGRGTAG